MKNKLSQKEREEPVNKGYFHDTLDEVLESKNFATKEYVYDAFEAFQKEMQRHVDAILEGQNHNTQLIIESLESKIDRIHRHVGMTSV